MSINVDQEQSDSDRQIFDTKVKMITGEYIKRQQRQHFLIYNVIPVIGLCVAVVSLWWFPIGMIELTLLLGMWALTMVGMSVGLHRFFAHRSFQTGQTMQTIFAILGCMSAQGPLISWVAVHRCHHEFSDLEGDPHSPNPALYGRGFWGTLRGLWHAHIGWLINHDYPSPVYYAPEFARDKTLNKINRYYRLWVGLGLLIPTVLGGILHLSWVGALQGLLWGGLVRMVVVDHSVLSINSFSHVYGTHPFNTGDQSCNNLWLAIPTFGESWQNNHHAFPASAKVGLKWWQLDLGYSMIWILQKCGLIWNVKIPSEDLIQTKTLSHLEQ